MITRSFSIATTWPLTTCPSAEAPVPKDSARRASKSSRVGLRVSCAFAMSLSVFPVQLGLARGNLRRTSRQAPMR